MRAECECTDGGSKISSMYVKPSIVEMEQWGEINMLENTSCIRSSAFQRRLKALGRSQNHLKLLDNRLAGGNVLQSAEEGSKRSTFVP